ncbi:predicted protein [Verticillium alfalfae VaMs.102]|uniref:Predicted protein n=1 Tax=Verticillium alfalfae (strain VaMs.102 / ATCC MYA-4576 / FGSC 10136) TaxID=526221 RepID=C9S953_VERA1|nr:predicted protein [Verticillium alfalfae VaMs.102]EEY14101.1 predicted protein [Verticillium alfalfae VaMs.102]
MANFNDEDAISVPENTPSKHDYTTSWMEIPLTLGTKNVDNPDNEDAVSFIAEKPGMEEAGNEASDLLRAQKDRKKEKRRAKKVARGRNTRPARIKSRKELAK